MDLDLDASLKQYFGFDAFRPGQRELIEAALAGRDALGVMPTGGGKSLVYQLPALMLPGLTICVSPLIALMNDQVANLRARTGAGVAAIHSGLSRDESRAIAGDLKSGAIKLLYVAPERLQSEAVVRWLAQLDVKLFVVDEAHCVSQWGHDFRPAYLALHHAINALKATRENKLPVLGLTATATPQARADITQRLGMSDPLRWVSSFDRENLSFEVWQCAPDFKPKRIADHLLANPGSSVVYAGRRKDVEHITATLNAYGVHSVGYHAGMSQSDRLSAQQKWASGEIPVVVATVAFGMGIDKPDVRNVLHYQHPANLEAYYQEAGRAGRDGKPATAAILYSGKDSSLANFFIRMRYPEFGRVLDCYRTLPTEASGQRGLDDLAFANSTSDLSDEQRNVLLMTLMESGEVHLNQEGLLYRTGAVNAFIDMQTMKRRQDADYSRLASVKDYCVGSGCQRAKILRYFGEDTPDDYACGNCSWCAATDGAAPKGGWAAYEALPQAKRAASSEEPTHVEGFATAEQILETIEPVLDEMLVGRDYISVSAVAALLAGSSARSVAPEWRGLDCYGKFAGTSQKHMRMHLKKLREEGRLDLRAPHRRDPDPSDDASGGGSPSYRTDFDDVSAEPSSSRQQSASSSKIAQDDSKGVSEDDSPPVSLRHEPPDAHSLTGRAVSFAAGRAILRAASEADMPMPAQLLLASARSKSPATDEIDLRDAQALISQGFLERTHPGHASKDSLVLTPAGWQALRWFDSL